MVVCKTGERTQGRMEEESTPRSALRVGHDKNIEYADIKMSQNMVE